MKPDEVEALLDRFAPAAPPPYLEEKIRRRLVRKRSQAAVFAVAASLLVAGVTFWAIFGAPEPGGISGPAQQTEDEKKVAELVRTLETGDLVERDRAMEELKKMGTGILPNLRRELGNAADAEVKARLQAVIGYLAHPAFERVKEIDLTSTGGVECAAWSPDGRQLAVGQPAGVVAIYDTASWKEVRRLEMPGGVRNVALSPDGKLLAVQGDHKVSLLRAEGYSEEASMQVEAASGSFLFIDNARLAFSGLWRDCVSLFVVKLDAGTLTLARDPNATQPDCFAATRDGSWLACWHGGGLGEPEIEIRETRSWEEVVSVEPPEQRHGRKPQPFLPEVDWALAFSPDSKFVAGRSDESPLYVYETGGWKLMKAWEPHDRLPVAVGFSTDSRYLITAGADGLVRAWRCGDWVEVASANLDGQGVRLLPSPARETVAVAVRFSEQAAEAHIERLPAGQEAPQKLLIFSLREP